MTKPSALRPRIVASAGTTSTPAFFIFAFTPATSLRTTFSLRLKTAPKLTEEPSTVTPYWSAWRV